MSIGMSTWDSAGHRTNDSESAGHLGTQDCEKPAKSKQIIINHVFDFYVFS